MTVRACVVGSTNVDLVLQVPTLPRPGETLLGATARREAGGKGGNQAVALARLGADVSFVSAVGDDADGEWSLDRLREEGVDVTAVAVVPGATGLAVVLVDATGENSIVVSPGANASVTAPAVVGADVLLLSLEVPLTTVAAAAAAGRSAGVPVVLNAAPACDLPASLLADVDVLVVNETEWETLGSPAVGRVVVTLGAAGCRLYDGGRWTEVPAAPVEVVDTTGAGDCFAAALALGIGSGQPLREAVALAVRAAALSVTKPGARGGLPHRSDL